MPDAPLPVTVIAGYLGAGKTTLVNRLLRHAGGRRLMVLVNDFGDLAIDADLIEAEEGGLLTLANGCVCCSIGGGLTEALVRVLALAPRPDHLVIEASGVARPGRIANIARAEPDLLLDGVVTLVDAENFPRQIADPLLADSLGDQVAAGDLLLLTKVDLVAPRERDAVIERLRAINPAAPLLPCVAGAVPVDTVLGGRPAAQTTLDAESHDHEQDYRRWSYESPGRFDRDKLKWALAAFPEGVLRIKGVVFLGDRAEPVAVHRVGRRVTLLELDRSSGDSSRLVAIGLRQGFDPARLDRLIEEARLPQS